MCEEDDEHLIGKTILLRSPETCCSERVCHTCYGRMSSVNVGYHIGILAVLFLTAKITQLLLSAKHLLQTKSPKIDWPEEFRKNFFVDKTEIVVSEEASAVAIIDDSFLQEDEGDGRLYLEKIRLETGGRGGVGSISTIELPVRLYLSYALIDALGNPDNRNPDGRYEIRLKDLVDESVFTISIDNEEITSSLNEIRSLLESKDHLGEDTYHGVTARMNDLLIRNGIALDSVHVEVIIRNLIRDPVERGRRPDFSVESPPYSVLRLADAIVRSDALAQSLSFENVTQQLGSPSTFRKSGTSLLDVFYER
jgi:hypothetical protein